MPANHAAVLKARAVEPLMRSVITGTPTGQVLQPVAPTIGLACVVDWIETTPTVTCLREAMAWVFAKVTLVPSLCNSTVHAINDSH